MWCGTVRCGAVCCRMCNFKGAGGLGAPTRPRGLFLGHGPQSIIQGGEGFRGGIISPWDISHFKFVGNFPRNFQVAVRNKPAAKFSKLSCPTVASA